VRYDNKEDAEDKLYPGNNLITTLDPKIQQACYDAMGNYEGAVIVTEVKTGRILAMVSKPDYDPNYIEEEWEKLLEDNESGTLLNRVTQGLYPPGSTFKIVDCIDLLQEDPDAMENYSFNCTGVFEQGGESIHCYEYEVHGRVGLEESFAHSCNASFANIGVNMISSDTMSTTLKSLLFNSKLPYDLPYVRSAVNMPNTLSTEGIMQMAIGQGTTSMTPLHLNMITSAVANGGVLMKPHLVDELHDAKGRTLKVYGSEQYGALMSEDVASKMTQMMRAVVTEGTANSLSGREYEACGKTGSAEFDNNKSSHAWFTGFAPAGDPEISVTVLIEGKGMGSSYAVPVAGRIFDAYFE
jgi:peptidoglycan glycosyltransferase